MVRFLLALWNLDSLGDMMSLIVYGIKNCNSMKKAFAFLEEHDKAYKFHDFKKETLSLDILNQIIEKISIDSLINTKGATYKKLKEQGISDITPIIITQNPSIIKRPLIVCYNDILIYKVVVGLQHLEELL